MSDDSRAASPIQISTNAAAAGGEGALLHDHDGAGFGAAMTISEKRTSLLDIVREHNQNFRTRACRIYVVGKLMRTLENKDEINNYYQKLFKSYNSEVEFVTGILLMYQNSFLHCLEAPSSVIQLFIKDFVGITNANINGANGATNNNAGGRTRMTNLSTLSSSSSYGQEYFRDVRVIFYQEDVSERIFSFWAIRSITSNSEIEYTPDEGLSSSLANQLLPQLLPLLQNLTLLGKQLGNLGKAELKAALDDIQQAKFKDLIPKQEVVLVLSSNNAFITCSEWVEYFLGQGINPLDYDLIWPAPKLIEI